MSFIANVITEIFMMVLCVTATPSDQNEIQVSMVTDRGYMDTMIVRREDAGYAVYDEMNGDLVKLMTIIPKDGSENIFVCTDHNGRTQTVNLDEGIKDFNPAELRSKDRIRLKTSDGGKIALDRADKITFIKADAIKETYVLH